MKAKNTPDLSDFGKVVGGVAKKGDVALAIVIAGIIFILLFPVSVVMIDFLLAISISIAVMILMTTLFIEKPLDLSVFPTVLLVTAIMRLSLNIASTRLILTNGHTGPTAAGHVIEAFGNFVMGGNIVIGLIVFAIITIINFVVITKGSGRIAEVAARFSLDAMPGKQMAIDADLSSGLIDERQARERRKSLEDESTFYGSMDGANKFVRGDAIAGLLITFINLIGGIIIGMVQRDLPFKSALQTYSLLTIGDGLVAQVPALIVSLSAGLLVSKAGIVGSADKAIFGQFSKFPRAMLMASSVMALMALMPGIPAFQFLFIAIITGGLGWVAREVDKRKPSVEEIAAKEKKEEEDAKAKEKEDSVSDALHIDTITLELGQNLLSLVNYQKGNKLTDQIKALRKQIAKDLGFVIPAIRIQDNIQLANDVYSIRIKNIECASGSVNVNQFLVMNPRGEEIQVNGTETKEPTFGLPAKWVDERYKEEAIFKQYTVVDPPTVIATHLTEVVKENITELFSYSETQKLLNGIAEEHKKLLSETVPEKISVTGMQRVLLNLLSEEVSIRDLPLILEAVCEAALVTKNILLITENVRMRLSRQINHAYTGDDGFMPTISLSQEWERIFIESILPMGGEERQLSMEPTKVQRFVQITRAKLDEVAKQSIIPAIVVTPQIRPYVRSIIARISPATPVLSQNEIYFKTKVKTYGQIS